VSVFHAELGGFAPMPTPNDHQPIRILHLSDIHFKVDKAWDAEPVLGDLAEFIAEEGKGGRVPDLVAITGDLAFAGTDEEYRLARAWLDQQLWPALPKNLSRDRLLLVPGNHDVDRKKVDFVAEAVQKNVLDAGDQYQIAKILGDAGQRDVLLKRHAAYLAFLGDWRGETQSLPWWRRSIEIRGVRLYVAGLDSAWMACGDKDRDQLLLGRYQMNQTVRDQDAKKADWRLALLHHPWDYFAEFDGHEARSTIHQHCDLLLRGHLHFPQSERVVPPDPSRACLELAAGCVYENSRYPNAFQWIELYSQPRRIKVLYRAWIQGAWTIDRNQPGCWDGEAEFNLAAVKPVPTTVPKASPSRNPRPRTSTQPRKAPERPILIESTADTAVGIGSDLSVAAPQPARGRKEGEVRPDAVAITESFAPGSTPSRSSGQAQPVYVSYAWDGESEAFVDEFEKQLPKDFSLIRDKSVLRAGDWISRFMRDIGRADMVLVVLSEKYLRSVYCMRELLYLHDTSQGEKATFLRRIVPLIMGDLSCARARDRHPYVVHWEQEHANLSALLEQRGLTTVGEADRREWLAIQAFKQHVSDLLAWVADTLMPQGTELRTRGIDAAIGLLRERAAALGDRGRDLLGSAVVTAPPPGPASSKPVPKRSVGKIHALAAAAIAECLDLIPALCDALASQPRVGGAKPVELAKWLCALDGDVRAAIRSLKTALNDAAKTLRREGRDILALGQRALDILGWMVITTVVEGYEREDAELAKAWFDGVKFEIPLGRNPCIEVLTARWRGGKAEFGPEKSRHAFGVDDITPNNLQELGFDDPAKPEIERHVDYVRRLAYQKLIGPAPPKLSLTQKRDLDARLDDEREEKNRRLRLVIDRNDPDCVFGSWAVIDALHDQLPQLLLIFVHSGQEPEDGVFVVSPSKLAAAIYGFLEEIEKLA